MRAAQFWGLCSLSDRVLPQLPQASRSATTINYTSSSCRQDQTFSTQGKTISKYCNISKTQGRGSINPPSPLPLLLEQRWRYDFAGTSEYYRANVWIFPGVVLVRKLVQIVRSQFCCRFLLGLSGASQPTVQSVIFLQIHHENKECV